MTSQFSHWRDICWLFCVGIKGKVLWNPPEKNLTGDKYPVWSKHVVERTLPSSELEANKLSSKGFLCLN
jgi:hypothetical protein